MSGRDWWYLMARALALHRDAPQLDDVVRLALRLYPAIWRGRPELLRLCAARQLAETQKRVAYLKAVAAERGLPAEWSSAQIRQHVFGRKKKGCLHADARTRFAIGDAAQPI